MPTDVIERRLVVAGVFNEFRKTPGWHILVDNEHQLVGAQKCNRRKILDWIIRDTGIEAQIGRNRGIRTEKQSVSVSRFLGDGNLSRYLRSRRACS